MSKLPYLVLMAIVAPAQAEWLEARNQNFIAYSNGSQKSLVDFVTRVEKYDQVLRLASGLKGESVGPPLRVILQPNAEAVRRLLWKNSRTIEGFYSATLRGPWAVINRQRATHQLDLSGEIILYHEYAHHFLLQYSQVAYPSWYVEGFAEYYSTVRFNQDGSIDVGKPALSRIPSLILDRWLPIERLFEPSNLKGPEVYMLYAQGWLLTHYLFQNSGTNKELGNYIRRINEGEAPKTAFAAAFGTDYAGLEKELRSYYKKMYSSGARYIRLKAAELKSTPITVRALSPAEAALLDFDARIGRNMPPEYRDKFLAELRSELAKYPNDNYAQTLGAEAALSANNLDEAERWVDLALESAPPSQRAMAVKGEILLRRIAADKGIDKNALRIARNWIVKANRANPDDPMALLLFHQTYLVAGQEPTENALAGLQVAFENAPQVDDIALTLAHELITRDRKAEAVNVLRPLAYSPHGGGAAEAARELIARARGTAEPAVNAIDVPSTLGSEPAAAP